MEARDVVVEVPLPSFLACQSLGGVVAARGSIHSGGWLGSLQRLAVEFSGEGLEELDHQFHLTVGDV